MINKKTDTSPFNKIFRYLSRVSDTVVNLLINTVDAGLVS